MIDMFGPTHKEEFWAHLMVKKGKYRRTAREYILVSQLLPLAYTNDAFIILEMDGNNQMPYYGTAQKEKTKVQKRIKKDRCHGSLARI